MANKFREAMDQAAATAKASKNRLNSKDSTTVDEQRRKAIIAEVKLAIKNRAYPIQYTEEMKELGVLDSVIALCAEAERVARFSRLYEDAEESEDRLGENNPLRVL